jgi:hypothetical protein
MSLKTENSRRVAKSRPVCMDLNLPAVHAVCEWFQQGTRTWHEHTEPLGLQNCPF